MSELLWKLGPDSRSDQFPVVDLGPPRTEGERPLTGEDVRAAAAYGAELVREKTLSRPAAIALQETFDELRMIVGSATVEDAAAAAPTVLSCWAHGMSPGAIRARHPEIAKAIAVAAAWYAAYLARDQRSAPTGESAAERILREPPGEHDRRVIEDYGAYLRADGHLRGTPEELLFEWRQFVQEVETGFRAEGDEFYYGDPSEQYENRLGGRDHLGNMMAMISPSAQERWREVIDPWDRRFEAATEPADDDPWYPARPWWWQRVPKRLGDL